MKESNFKFTNPIVEKLVYNISEKYNPSITPTVNNNFEVNIARSESSNEAIVRLKVTVDGNLDDANSPFSVSLTIGAKFIWDDSYDEETISSLLSINAPALLLGYARPIISSITTTCPCGAYNLPFYNFLQK